MLKRTLLKRALPILLSVSLMLSPTPAAAYAAEYAESEAIEEAVPEETEPAAADTAELDSAAQVNTETLEQEDPAPAAQTETETPKQEDPAPAAQTKTESPTPTKIQKTVTVKAETKTAGETLSKVYQEDTPISYETDIKHKISLSVIVPDENGDTSKDIVLKDAQAVPVWCDADKNELGPDPEAAPTDAGTYYIDFQYLPPEEQQEAYKASKGNYLKTVICPAPLTLKVSEPTGEYFTGMTEKAVLKDADYMLADEKGGDFYFDRSLFWGVSYDNPDHTQAYEPVFKLIRADKNAGGSKEEWTDNAGSMLDASKYSYRLAFTGKKAVCAADGTAIDERDVNGGGVNTADRNHCIATDEKTLFDQSVKVPVQDGIAVKMDVSAILDEGVNEAEEDLMKEHTFHDGYADITVKETGSIALEIEIDETKLASTVKDYDAKPFYATEEDAYADLLKAVTVKKKADGETLATVPALSCSIYDTELGKYADGFEDMVYAGVYRLELSFSGDETYAPCEAENAVEYTINALALQAVPYVYDNIAAGTYVCKDSKEYGNGIFNGAKTIFTCEKMPEEDKPAFEQNSCYFNLSGTVRKADTADAYEGHIRYNARYTVQLGGELAYPYSRNYDIQYIETPFQAAVRGQSAVSAYDADKTAAISTQWNGEETATTITPLKGIPYIANGKTTDFRGKEIELEGNYLEFQITAPEEFKEDTGSYQTYFDGFMYLKSIQQDAKGHVLGTDSKNGVISVLVPAEEKAVRSFAITWENGYTETFHIDFTNAVFLDDLTKAAAPKSLAFNGVNTKMAVGERQQLDVKIKKAQISDIIYLDYRVLEGQDVISVTNDDGKATAGCVTALKPGTATVAAVPVRMENGEKRDIAKAATVKITVSDVSVPAVKKITAIDNQADITYAKPSNGCRREVYVLEGGKRTEEDFKNAIRLMANGNWEGIFAVPSKYYTTAAENAKMTDIKKQLLSIEVSGLKADTEYTVYIRNVSGIRTLYDGAFVAESAKGSVKSFKTTLPQVKSLSAYFKQDAENEDAEPQNISRKEIPLTQKTEQLYVSGKFWQKPEYEAADAADDVWVELPLDTKQHKGYAAPKLTYWISAEEDAVPVEEIRDFRNYIYMEGTYYKKADIASIDKKGKITLKGTGTVYVHVRDSETKAESAAQLHIGADADNVTGKGQKLAVGQGICLSSLLTYAVGRTAIAGYGKQDLSIPEESLKEINGAGNFSIVPTGDGDYYITALKPKAECGFTVTDKLVARQQGSADVAIKMQSAPIEPVKNMAVTDIVDNGFVICFAYAVQADDEISYTKARMLYRIVITDARNSVVDSFVVNRGSAAGYDGAKKLVLYQYPYSSRKLARLSGYSISVTPIYGGDFSAKPAVKKISTTNFPASYQALAGHEYGGETIDAISYAGGSLNQNFELKNNRYLTSGNAYTLRLSGSGSVQISRDRMTDSLTWKSYNTKVATVKANAGTYTASLNAVKAGITVVEATSKITKKVIARYPVFVKAAGNAKDDYYGDYEYIGESLYRLDPFYNSNVAVLTEANPVRVAEEDLADVTIYDWQNKKYRAEKYKWVQFKAPKSGEYAFQVDSLANSPVSMIVDGSGAEHSASQRTFTILEGQTYYFKICDAFEMTVKCTKPIDPDPVAPNPVDPDPVDPDPIDPDPVDPDPVIPDPADPDPIEPDPVEPDPVIPDPADPDPIEPDPVDPDPEKPAVEPLPNAPITITNQTKVYAYTAAQKGRYAISYTVTPAKAVVAVQYGIGSLENASNEVWKYAELDSVAAGAVIYIKVSAESETEISIDLKAERIVPEELSAGTPMHVTAMPYKNTWYLFKSAETGRYVFDKADDANNSTNIAYYSDITDANPIAASGPGEYYLEAGETVYMRLSTYNRTEPQTAVIKIEKITSDSLTEESVTLRKGETKQFAFEAPEDGLFAFSTEGVDDIKITPVIYFGESGEEKTEKGFYATKYLETGEAFQYSVGYEYDALSDENGAEAEAPESVTFRIKAARAVPQVMQADTSTEVTAARYEWKLFTFKAPEDGRYTFKVDNAKSGIANLGNADLNAKYVECRYIDDKDLWKGKPYTLPLSRNAMRKGDRLMLAVYYEGSGASERFRFSVEQLKPEVTNGTMQVDLEPHKSEWYEYTVPKTGTYHLAATGCTVQLFDTIIDSSSAWYGSLDFTRNEGDKVYIRVDNTSSTAKTAKVKITFKEETAESGK